MLAVVFAVASAFMYALASVLQQRGAAEQPPESSLRIGLLTRLLRHPGWMLGLACDIAGYVFQFLALGHGPLVVVQPLLVCGLLFALPLGAAWSGRRLAAGDWLAAVVVCAGLAVFLIVASPGRGRVDIGGAEWTSLLVATTVISLVLVITSVDRPPWQRAVLLSAAAGVIYGAAAALTVTSAHLLGRGVPFLLTHWQPYVLAVGGVAGMVVAQSAFQAGSLDASLPTMSVVDPVASIAIGVLAFDETISSGPGAVTLEVVALLAMCAGIVMLARSEAVRAVHAPRPARPGDP